MNITISGNIKRLRHERDLTQDELATELGVTPQSVSKWEVGACYPDIETLPLIANFFGVSLDDLLGMDSIRDEERIVEFRQKEAKLIFGTAASADPDAALAAVTEEILALNREIIREFPNNFELQMEYASRLVNEAYSPENCREALAVLDKILARCTDAQTRYTAEWSRVGVYEKLGETENAYTAAEALPFVFQSRESSLMNLLNNEQMKNQGLSDESFARFRDLFGSFALPLSQLLGTLLHEKHLRGTEFDDEWYSILDLRTQLIPYSHTPQLSPEDLEARYAMHFFSTAMEVRWDNADKALDLLDEAVKHALVAAPQPKHKIEDGEMKPDGFKTVAEHILSVLDMVMPTESFDAIRDNPRLTAAIERLKNA